MHLYATVKILLLLSQITTNKTTNVAPGKLALIVKHWICGADGRHTTPQSAIQGLHPIAGKDGLILIVIWQRRTVFSSEYYQVLIATHLSTPEGWKAELA